MRQESVALFKAAGNYVQQVLRVSFHLKEAGICKFEGRCYQEPCTQLPKVFKYLIKPNLREC